jgi:adenylate cyclase
MPTVAELQEELIWKNRSIAIMLEIDRIRDNASEEHEMATAILGKLVEAVEPDLGLLFLYDEEGGQLQLRSMVDRARVHDASLLEIERQVAARTAEMPGGQVIETGLELAQGKMVFIFAISLRIGNTRLGSLLLINIGTEFSTHRKGLIGHAVSQIDSALQHSHILRELHREKKELEMIFRIDRIRDSNEDLQPMLDAVLPEICKAIDAQTGFIMLFDRSGQELELRATTDHDLLALEDPKSPIHEVTREAITNTKLINRSYGSGPVRSIVGQPLILRDKLIGVLGVINRRDRDAFTRMDIHLLRAVAGQIDTAIFEGLQTQRLRSAFGQCVGPEVMRRLLGAGNTDPLIGDRVPITTLFSDIRGFTNMSEHTDPGLLQVILNDHLSALTNMVLSHEGTLDKYIGDAVMCFFNAPERQLDHAIRAVRLALEMQQAHQEVIERWCGRLVVPPIGIGISTGETIVGNFGSVKRLEYTVIGNDVNLAARLCGAAAGGQVLISQGTYDLVRDLVVAEEMPAKHLKGIDEEVRNWSVTGLR